MKASLAAKFNLVLLLVFAISFATIGFVCNRLLQNNARAEIVENARIMMEAALAVRAHKVAPAVPRTSRRRAAASIIRTAST